MDTDDGTTPPPRLTVLAARDADLAVVLRRGPTDWSALSLWDTVADTLTHGGWIRAQVDHRRCDLSPDGRLVGAFVQQHGRRDDPRHDTWVAISRPPWWHALALWFNGTSWDLGLFFPDARSCSVGPDPPDEGAIPDWFRTDAPLPHPRPGPDWTTQTVPHNRRLRDGWTSTGDGWWERPLRGGGHAVVRETAVGTSHIDTEAALRHGDDLVTFGPTASLDVDHRGRALVARQGRLEVHTIAHGAWRAAVVADLGGSDPTPRPAPSWARDWPRPHQG